MERCERGDLPSAQGLPKRRSRVRMVLLATILAAQTLLSPALPAIAQDRNEDRNQDQTQDQTGSPNQVRVPDQAAPGGDRAGSLDALTPAEQRRLRALLDQPAPRDVSVTDRRAPAPAVVAAHPAAKPAAPAPAPANATAAAKPKTVSLAPDSLAAEVLAQAATVQKVLVFEGQSFGALFGDMALTGRWLHREMVDPDARAALLDALWRGTAVVVVGLAVEHLLLLALRRPLRALGRDARVTEIEEEEATGEAPSTLAGSASPLGEPPGLVQAGPPAPAPATLQNPTLSPTPQPGAMLPGSPILPTAPQVVPPGLGAGTIDPIVLAEAAERSARQAEARSRDAAHRRQTLRLFRRLPYAVLRLLLKLLPLCAFLAIGNFAATSIADRPRTQLIIVTVTNIYGIGRALWLLADMLLAPKAPGVRLVRVADEQSRFLSRWWSWLVAVPVVAICSTDIGRILDLPNRAGMAFTRAVVLVEHVLLAVLIWQTRHRVAAALHPPKRLRARSFGRLLVRLADYWWIAALFFDGALWVVWAAQIRGGYSLIWHLFLSSVLIIGACRLVGIMLLGGLDRVFRIEPDTELRYPGFERRASRYYPALRRIVTWALSIVCVVLLLEAWGVPAFGFFSRGSLGTHLLSAVITILVTLAVGVIVWELVNGSLDRQIARFGDTGQMPRAVRLQTLLPILRTLLFVVLGAIMVLTVLGEVGVNIAPLLAGAGIIGVAVGFGSQKLVQDFITGIFLLVENAMQVGDNVTVAGISGVVEHLSIRTLRLRGGDGSIQIIPFSSVSTVANLSRDYAVASMSVSIGFAEDTDRVCDLFNEIGSALRTEEAFAGMTLADFGLNGVDSLGEYAVAISGTMKCTVAGRWPVQREFNRRLRARMVELEITRPMAHQSIDLPKLTAMLERRPPAYAESRETPSEAPAAKEPEHP